MQGCAWLCLGRHISLQRTRDVMARMPKVCFAEAAFSMHKKGIAVAS